MKNYLAKNILIFSLLNILCIFSCYAQGAIESELLSKLTTIRLANNVADKTKLLVIVDTFEFPTSFIESLDPFIYNINSTSDPAVVLSVSENFLTAKVRVVVAKPDSIPAPTIGSNILFSMTGSNLYLFHEEIPKKDGDIDPDAEDPAGISSPAAVEDFIDTMENPERIPTLQGQSGRWLLALKPIILSSSSSSSSSSATASLNYSSSSSAGGFFNDSRKNTAYAFLFQKKLAKSGEVFWLEHFSDAFPVVTAPATSATLLKAKGKKTKVQDPVSFSPAISISKAAIPDIQTLSKAARLNKLDSVAPKTDTGKNILKTLKLQK